MNSCSVMRPSPLPSKSAKTGMGPGPMGRVDGWAAAGKAMNKAARLAI
ncbi:hypothetical protein Y695_02215 [Hydrogenophaga sp. T4]|nr:hypothetical protein Y695_02215 [Hydrogenophaga sp. T4]